jgi:hypothetical protein
MLHIFESRRDCTLLTVDFNLRIGQRPLCAVVPQGLHFVVFLCRPCRIKHRKFRLCEYTSKKDIARNFKIPALSRRFLPVSFRHIRGFRSPTF